MTENKGGGGGGAHRLLAALIAVETQAVPADPAPPVLSHALRVGVVPQQPISKPGVTHGCSGGRSRTGEGGGGGLLTLEQEGGER